MHKIKTLFAVLVGLFIVFMLFSDFQFNTEYNLAIANVGSNVVFIDTTTPLSFSATAGGYQQTAPPVQKKSDFLKNFVGLAIAVVVVVVGANKMGKKKARPTTAGYKKEKNNGDLWGGGEDWMNDYL